MKIAYLAHWDASRESGVLKKIYMQARAWVGLGNTAGIFFLSPTETLWPGLAGLQVEAVARGNVYERPQRAKQLTERILGWKPDCVYMRLSTYYPAFEDLMKVCPTFLELNDSDRFDYHIGSSWWKKVYQRVTTPRLLSLARGIVYIAQDFAERTTQPHIPNLVLGNGVELERYPELPPHSGARPRLVFLGDPPASRDPLLNFMAHDKILFLARQFPQWDFDLIGMEKRDFAEELPENVQAHGFLTQDQYEPILAAADIGIGVLGLHRKGLNEASPIKVREYLAYGLPVISGHPDTDFLGGRPFLLELPNYENNVRNALPVIEQFVLTWKGKRVRREEIQHVSWKEKEALKLQFFQENLRQTFRLP